MNPSKQNKYRGVPYELPTCGNRQLIPPEIRLVNFLLRLRQSGLSKKDKKDIFINYQKSNYLADMFPTGKKVKWRDRNKRIVRFKKFYNEK